MIAGGSVGAAIGVAIPLLFHHDALTDEPAPVPRRAATAHDEIVFSFGGRF